jgi:cytochrome o ubiquinol oxidase subunit II
VGGAAVLRSVLPVVLISLAACQTAVLSPAGPVGEADRIVLMDSLAIMLAIVVPTIVAILAFAYWFRSTNTRARYRPEWAYSGRLELIVWSIPALVVFFLGGIAWISAHLLDPAVPLKSKAEPLKVEVVSLDWKWLFIYPQQNVASVNRMVVPAGVPLDLKITSASVFNVFFVPRLGSMIYVSRRTSAAMASPAWRSTCTRCRLSNSRSGRLPHAGPVRCWMRPPTATSSSRART